MNFFDNKPAIEAHLLDIERALTSPDAGKKKPTLRERILAKGVIFLADLIGKRVLELHGQHDLRLRVLEQRVPATPFFWIWADGDQFTVGAFATHRGALWQCERPTKAEPGRNDDWKLIVGSPSAA